MSVSDNDMTAAWADYRKERSMKKRGNQAASTERLREAGIPFATYNGGVHLVVADRVDFWPGTGLWIERGPAGVRGRGVQGLLQRMKEDHSNARRT